MCLDFLFLAFLKEDVQFCEHIKPSGAAARAFVYFVLHFHCLRIVVACQDARGSRPVVALPLLGQGSVFDFLI